MTYDIEIMLRGNDTVFSETVHHLGNDVGDWTVDDVSTMMHTVLKAIDRALNPGRADEPVTTMRGVNWIVSTVDDHAVVALEIHSASAVAGRFRIDPERLETLLTDAAKTPMTSGGGVVH